MSRIYEVNDCVIVRGNDVPLGGGIWQGSKYWYVRSKRTGRALTYERTLRDAKAYAREYQHPQQEG